MIQIHFHDDFHNSILEGSKTQTARIDEPIPNLGNGEAIFSNAPSVPIEITKVTHKSFSDLSLEDVRKDGFDSKQKLWEVLIGFYPDLLQTDLLMLIEFKRVVI